MLKIDEEFKKLIPPLTNEEFEQLEQNCLNEGIRENIIVWGGVIIDGHNRYEIALKHGLEYNVFEKAFETRSEVIEWIILNQFGRRNLSMYDRAKLALRLKEVFAAKGIENKKLGAEITNSKDTLLHLNVKAIEPVNTQKNLADVAGISHFTMYKVEEIEKTASPELQEALTNRVIKINRAYEITKEVNAEVGAEAKQRINELELFAKLQEQAAIERAKEAEIKARIQAENEAFMQEQAEKNRILEAKLQAERERFEAEKIERERIYQLELQKIEAEKIENERKAVAAKLKEIEEAKKSHYSKVANDIKNKEIKTQSENNQNKAKELNVQYGDVYLINNKHYLIINDANNVEEIKSIIGEIDCVLTDPPYGINYKSPNGSGLTIRGDYDIINNDNKDYEPSVLFKYSNNIITWGANHYANKLPNSPGWIVWDKREGEQINNNSDCELAWTNMINSARLFHHKWNGMIKASENNSKRIHPTQKPIKLFVYCLEIAKAGAKILDLYAGSGTTLYACEETNRTAYLVENDINYAAAMINRFMLNFEVEKICK